MAETNVELEEKITQALDEYHRSSKLIEQRAEDSESLDQAKALTEALSDEKNRLKLKSRRDEKKFFGDLDSYRMRHNKLVRAEFFTMMEIGLRILGIGRQDSTADLDTKLERIAKLRETVEKMESAYVKSAFEYPRPEVKRMLSAIQTGIMNLKNGYWLN